MLNHETSAALAKPIRVMRVIVGALVAGPLTFLVIAIASRDADAKPREGASIMTYAALSLAVVAITARMIVPNLIANSARKKIAAGTWKFVHEQGEPVESHDFFETTGDAGKLCMVFQLRLIIGSALLEGAGFLSIFAFMIEGQAFALVPAGLLLLGILLGFPTTSSVEHWIDDQIQLLEEDRRGLK